MAKVAWLSAIEATSNVKAGLTMKWNKLTIFLTYFFALLGVAAAICFAGCPNPVEVAIGPDLLYSPGTPIPGSVPPPPHGDYFLIPTIVRIFLRAILGGIVSGAVGAVIGVTVTRLLPQSSNGT